MQNKATVSPWFITSMLMCNVMMFYWFYTRVLIMFTKLTWWLNNKYIGVILTEYTWAKRTWYRMSEYQERKPTNKGLLARVKWKQRNARTSAILSVFSTPCESVSLQKSCYVAGSITFQSIADFQNLSENCREKAVFVQRHNTSIHSKFRQTALKLTP